MNRRPTFLAAIALTAAAALSLSACGSDDSPKDKKNDKIAGADRGSETSTSPSPSASAAAGRPKIEMPSDLSYTFDWPKSDDEDKDAVLGDSEQSIKAVDLAIVKQNALDKAYLNYYEGEGAAGTQKFIQNYVDHKAAVTGAYRFYDPEVAVNKGGTASLSYCEDQGKAYVKDLKTGKVKKTEVNADSYVLYHTSLRKSDGGVWVIREIISEIGSAKCRP